MSVTAGNISKLRRMIAEPTTAAYSDADLVEILASHPVMDERGEQPFTWDFSTTPPGKEENDQWIPTYDFHLSAAEIWEEKAAAVADEHDFSADGADFSRSQVYQNYIKNARFHRARRYARNQTVMVQPLGGLGDQ